MTCLNCGGFVPARAVATTDLVPPQLEGRAECVRCKVGNRLAGAPLFVIDMKRLRRIRLSSPADYVK
jgi:hypothetical protein